MQKINSVEKETKQAPVTFYAEMTPNPSTMKFVANIALIDYGKTVEYATVEETEDSPLATRLFSFPFVTKVFISNNFITLTKNDSIEWQDVFSEIREYVTNYMVSGHPVFKDSAKLSESVEEKVENEAATPTESNSVITHVEPKSDKELQIVQILEEYVRPAVESDGGAIHFSKYEPGKLTVVLKGACSGCPSSSQTLKNGIQGLFDQMMPEVKEIVALEE